jgi:DNA-binding response OmpR family regulator
MELRACLETKDFWLDGKMLLLHTRETEVLAQLVIYRGRTTPRDTLSAIWDDTATESDLHCVQNTICKLRQILGRNAIATRPGVGYVLRIPTSLVPAGPVSGPLDPPGTAPGQP